jgi:hypothetical protein
MKLNRKNKFLLFGFVLALYICYSFAISNTIKYYKEYNSKKELIRNEGNLSQLTQELLQREKNLDAFLSHHKINSSISFQNDLLKQLNEYSFNDHLKIIEFTEPHIITENNITTTSYIFTLEGSFNGCLSLINKIEKKPDFGIVKHINFTKKRDYKTNINHLFVEVIIQQNKEG